VKEVTGIDSEFLIERAITRQGEEIVHSRLYRLSSVMHLPCWIKVELLREMLELHLIEREAELPAAPSALWFHKIARTRIEREFVERLVDEALSKTILNPTFQREFFSCGFGRLFKAASEINPKTAFQPHYPAYGAFGKIALIEALFDAVGERVFRFPSMPSLFLVSANAAKMFVNHDFARFVFQDTYDFVDEQPLDEVAVYEFKIKFRGSKSGAEDYQAKMRAAADFGKFLGDPVQFRRLMNQLAQQYRRAVVQRVQKLEEEWRKIIRLCELGYILFESQWR